MAKAAFLCLLLLQDPAGPKPFAESIDAAVLTVPGWNARIAPPAMDDVEFIYRISQDLLGEVPKDELVRAFTAEVDPRKREKRVDELLASPRFGEFWARRLAEVFLGGPLDQIRMERIEGMRPDLAAKAVEAYVGWLRDRLNQDRPYAEIVREMVEATGRFDASPAVGYKLSHFRGVGYPQEFAMGLSRGLLGVRLFCARCHDHPFDRWRVEDYYGLAAFVVRERAERSLDGSVVTLATAPSGEMKIEPGFDPNDKDAKVKLSREGTAPPVFLFGGGAQGGDDRAKVLAQLVTSKANTQLPRALVNRVWGWLFRRALVEPADDFNLRNKALSPHLLEALSRGFVENGHSLKALLRELCRTKTYQISDKKGPTEEDLAYIRGVYRKPWPARAVPKDFPKFAFPEGWAVDHRVRGWPYYRIRVRDKESEIRSARLFISKGGSPVEEAFRQLEGAQPKVEKIQGKQEIVLAEATGTFSCDLEAGRPRTNQREIYARVGKPPGWSFRLAGPAETVAAWRSEFIEILKGLDP
jgi:hypothetical protein